MPPSHRERVLRALDHEETDRVPIDFGGGPATLIHPDAYRALLAHLGFEEEQPAEELRGEGQVVSPSERVLRRFDIDVRGFYLGEPDIRPRRQLDGSSYIDEWGATWAKAHPTAPYINVKGPLQHLDDPSPSHLDRIAWPVPDDPGRARGLRARVERLRSETDHAIVLNLPNSTFALAQRLRGFTELLEDLILNPSFAEALQERVTDVICGIAETALGAAGDLIDGVSFADDMGIQTQAFMSRDLYRTMVKPHHARFVATLRRHTRARIIMHSDGAIYDLLPELIDCGVQVVNPVQVNAEGMDPERLKREFGADLCFWGGVDTQEVLPHGSPADVAAEVRRRLADLGRGGGYVLASVHNIQAEVPPENVIAMFETAHQPWRVVVGGPASALGATEPRR
jgi:uroporphyrinogen decarboxylase